MPSEEEVVEVPACGAMRCVLPPPSAPGPSPSPSRLCPQILLLYRIARPLIRASVTGQAIYKFTHAQSPAARAIDSTLCAASLERRRLSGRRRLIRVPEESTPPPRGRILAECARWSTNDERAGGSPSLLVLRIQCRRRGRSLAAGTRRSLLSYGFLRRVNNLCRCSAGLAMV